MKVVDDREADGVRARAFRLEGQAGEIPGILWTPPAPPRRALPLVLVGHGASGSKRQDYVRALARRLVLVHGMAAAAIDGPVHGERRKDGGRDGRLQFLDFVKAWSTDPEMTDRMVSDWRVALDGLSSLDEAGFGPVGYWGLSMGTILGLPLVAAEPRVAAAVLGLMGLAGPTSDRIAADAPLVRCPVLFLVQWEDGLFPRETAFALFDAIGSANKRMHASPGGHGEVPEDEFRASADFLADRLAPAE